MFGVPQVAELIILQNSLLFLPSFLPALQTLLRSFAHGNLYTAQEGDSEMNKVLIDGCNRSNTKRRVI
jgi:hypothetical protein